MQKNTLAIIRKLINFWLLPLQVGSNYSGPLLPADIKQVAVVAATAL